MKKGLLFGGVLCLAALVFVWFRSSSTEDDEDLSKESVSAQPEIRRPVTSPKRMVSGDAGSVVPKRLSGTSDGEAGVVRRYVTDDGTIVRDHRASPPPPNYERRIALPADLSKVQSDTLVAVRVGVRPAMRKCIATHTPNAEEGAKAKAVLTVSITDELLHVDAVEFESSGLDESAAAELKACATEAMTGFEKQVTGSEDVAEHVMTFPYLL